ncbi:alpha/beta hydrolase [Streptomyces sp. VNUA116]|uniref:alpha/beta hydrolase n=1 Tax=Streptomyces sp. VNUA116 TaxID=3062449 RepID=UPI0026753D15|nr:alpha/beta hydrolase [Streptomyces sp. VNUA116]WKU43538.1 alpha/beta hydrolase [Streptomyces sp. VNUA116]
MRHHHISRRAVTTSALAATAGALLGGSTGVAAATPGRRPADGITLRLPAPTGPYRTGVTTLYLVDRSRRDPLEPGIPVREVMASVFYPARTVRGCRRAPQMTAGAAADFGADGRRSHPELPASGVNWAATMTHSYADAPADAARRRPVLLYSPGGGDARTMGTALAEELASHGRVVVTIDHPGDGCEVEFPVAMTGRETIRPTVLRYDPRTDPGLFRTLIDTRIADIRFVLDQLEALAAGRNPDAAGRPLPERLGRALDLRRTGAYGHSAGGTAVTQAMYDDRRIGAAADLEGYLDRAPETPGGKGELYPVARYGTDRPLLLLGSDGFQDREGLERSWPAVLSHSRGRACRRQLDRAAHWVFTDYAALVPQLQAAGLVTAADCARMVGTADPAAAVPAVRHHLLSFFARHLPAR